MSALRYSRETNSTQSYWLRFAPITREPGSWKEEIYAAARDIASRTKKPLWICSSGGIDSEIACRAFFDQHIPFSVLTLEHAGGTNEHDIRYARKWCSERGVSHTVVPIDMTRFLSTDLERYMEKYPAIHPFRYLQIKLMESVEEMGGFAVLCSGEQRYYINPTREHAAKRDVSLPLSNGTIVPLEWCKDNNTDHEPYFHFATPELCLAYLRLPLISFALDNPEAVFRHPANTYTLKRLVYQSVWTDIEVRYKFDGYERIRATLFGEAMRNLESRFQQSFEKYDIPVPTLEAQLMGKPI